MWAAEFEKINEAYTFERRLHGWSRAKKQALIDGDFDRLPVLSSRSRAGRAARAAAARKDEQQPPDR